MDGKVWLSACCEEADFYFVRSFVQKGLPLGSNSHLNNLSTMPVAHSIACLGACTPRPCNPKPLTLFAAERSGLQVCHVIDGNAHGYTDAVFGTPTGSLETFLSALTCKGAQAPNPCPGSSRKLPKGLTGHCSEWLILCVPMGLRCLLSCPGSSRKLPKELTDHCSEWLTLCVPMGLWCLLWLVMGVVLSRLLFVFVFVVVALASWLRSFPLFGVCPWLKPKVT